MSIDLINQVFAGTPASGDLQRGDVIVLVQHRDASQLTHQEANEIIKNSGGSVSFTIRRFLYIFFIDIHRFCTYKHFIFYPITSKSFLISLIHLLLLLSFH